MTSSPHPLTPRIRAAVGAVVAASAAGLGLFVVQASHAASQAATPGTGTSAGTSSAGAADDSSGSGSTQGSTSSGSSGFGGFTQLLPGNSGQQGNGGSHGS